MKINVNKDVVYNVIRTTNKLKIPNTSRQAAGDNIGLTGDIIFDRTSDIFYGYTGITWVPFHGNYAPNSGSFVTWQSDSSLPNSKVLAAGTDIFFNTTSSTLTINAYGASSITLQSLGTGKSLVPGGVDVGPVLDIKSLTQGAGINITESGTEVQISAALSPPTVNASFLTVTLDPSLPSSRKLAAGGPDISFLDGGPYSTFTINVLGASSVTLQSAGSGVSIVYNNGPDQGPILETKSLTGGSGITLISTTTNITIATTYTRTSVDTSPYTILLTDDILAVSSFGGPITLNLPLISSIGGNNYKKYVIVDEGGNASNVNIVVASTSPNVIIGTNAVAINENYNSISVYSNGSNAWFLV